MTEGTWAEFLRCIVFALKVARTLFSLALTAGISLLLADVFKEFIGTAKRKGKRRRKKEERL